MDNAGVTLLREGHFPGFLFRYLLGDTMVDLTQARAAGYPLVPTHSWAEAARVAAPQLRREIIACLERE